MSEMLFTVFLSGTRRDLAPFYPAAKSALEGAFPHCEVRIMEDAEPEDIPVDHWSRREATKPDVLVGLVGHYYGTVLRGQDRSLTEQEFDVASQVGVDRLMFLTEAGDRSAASAQDALEIERVRQFRQKVNSRVRTEVSSPEDFTAKAVQAVRAWQQRTYFGTTQSGEDFYAHSGTELIGHSAPMIGQDDALARLLHFLASDRRAFMVHAAWGRGKSRLLLEFARTSAADVRFIRRGAPVTRQRLNISAADPCVLVLEDAWQRSDEEVRILLDFLARCSPAVKLIASTWTSREPGFAALFRDAGIPARSLEVLSLPALSDKEQRRLVAHILGSDSELAYRIAVSTQGSTLAGVVAARLIQRRQATLADFQGSTDFIGEVLERFQDAILREGGADSVVRERRTSILRAVALCAPAKASDATATDALATFLHIGRDDLIRELEALEDAGLVLRRGGLHTLPVDAIRVHQARRACLSRSGDLTGYAERALRDLGSVYRANLLHNLALVDWQASQSGEHFNLLQEVWPEIASTYEQLPPSERRALLNDLADVSPYQPVAALRFARRALSSGLGSVQETNPFFGGQFKVSLQSLHDSLTKVVEGTLYDHRVVPDACDLLWGMAEADPQSQHSHPSSAERALSNLGTLGRYKPLVNLEAFLDWLQRSIERRTVPGDRLAEYIRPMLEKEVLRVWADDGAMHFETGQPNVEMLLTLHERASELLDRLARDDDLKVASAGISALGEALKAPAGMLGRVVSEAEHEIWEPELLKTLDRLHAVREHHRSRAVDLCLLPEVLGPAEFSHRAEVKQRAEHFAQELRDALEGSLEFAVTPAFRAGWRPIMNAEDMHFDAVRRVVGRARVEGISPRQLVMAVTDAVEILRTVRIDPEPGPFLFAATREIPGLHTAYFEAVLARDDHPLAFHADAVLGGLLEAQLDPWRHELERAMSDGGPHVQRATAMGHMRENWRGALGPEKALEHLRAFLRSEDHRTRRAALSALHMAKELDAAERGRLLLDYDLSGAPDTSRDWARALDHDELYQAIPPDERARLVNGLQHVSKFDYSLEKLLARLSADAPAPVVDLMLDRVRRAATTNFGLEAVPHIGQIDCFAALPPKERERGLVALGEILGHEDPFVQQSARNLFARLGTGDIQMLRKVRDSWISSGAGELLLRTAESFRAEPAGAVLSEEETVARLAIAAARLGTEVTLQVTSELVDTSMNGARSGKPGEPTDEDVAIRDGARAIATKYPPASPVAELYQAIFRRAEQTIAMQKTRHEEGSLGR